MSAALCAIGGCGGAGSPGVPDSGTPDQARPAKLFACSQGTGQLDVLDGTSLAVRSRIAAGERRMPHMAEVSPAGDRLFVTSPDADGEAPDELLVVDPASDTLVGLVPLDAGAFIAHVVVAPGGVAYVSGWGSNLIYRVDAVALGRLPDIVLPPGRNPHGLRLSVDGNTLYSAHSNGTVGELHAASGGLLREFPVPGAAVQLALGDGVLFASIAEPPAVARIDLQAGTVETWPLPEGSRGPAALALTPDGRELLVAEQGSMLDPGERLFALDAATGAVVSTFQVGKGTHGIALAESGALAFVSGLYDASVTVVDLARREVVQRATVDDGPAGLAAWSPAVAP